MPSPRLDARNPDPSPEAAQLAKRSRQGEALTFVAFLLVLLGVLASRLGAPRPICAALWASVGVAAIAAAWMLMSAAVGRRRLKGRRRCGGH